MKIPSHPKLASTERANRDRTASPGSDIRREFIKDFLVPEIFENWERIDPLDEETQAKWNQGIKEYKNYHNAHFTDRLTGIPSYRVSKAYDIAKV
jgi:hypothetical protein